MANPDHVALLQASVKKWNSWRLSNRDVLPDLRLADLSGATLSKVNLSKAKLNGADLFRADLSEANLSQADLYGASLRRANLYGADLSNADLSDADVSSANLVRANLVGANLTIADLSNADLSESDLSGADLTVSNLTRTDLTRADLSGADLSEADLSLAYLISATLVRTNLTKANLTGCWVYGLAAWDVQLEGATQKDLVITTQGEPLVTVDNLEVAQFIYLLLNNQKIRHVIDTITSKVVLILGRFTPDRKPILDAIRDELRKRDYLPVLFDFEKPSNRDITETVSTLAHMARFVIADLSDPKSIPQELAHVAPLLPSVPIMPLIVRPQKEYAMFEHFFGFRHVLKPFRYRDERHLLASLEQKVINPAEKMAQRVAGKRSKR
jgi:uncharacterized protein YjbI with pentapeptide repeats